MAIAEYILRNRVARLIGRTVPAALKDNLESHLSERVRYRGYHQAIRGERANTASILERLKSAYQPVDRPLLLVSQIQRSGGSLLSQLFDGHPNLLPHPHELKIGYPSKENWPRLDPAMAPQEQFRFLFELATIKMCEYGYAKSKKDTNLKNFFFLPYIQFELFNHIWIKRPPTSPRSILDHYFTSYFNSWLNYKGQISQARFLTAFVPQLVYDAEGMSRFWQAYPDGHLVCIIRSPLSWYPSAVRLGSGDSFDGLEDAAMCWCQSTEAAFRERRRQGDRVTVLNFSDLVQETELTMRYLCQKLGLDFDPVLLSPTFNGEPMAANTSFELSKQGAISDAPLGRETHLNEKERAYLEEHCMPLYRQAVQELIDSVPNTLQKVPAQS